jgi:hypothetical protein
MDALNQLSQTGLVVEKLTKTFERGSVALKQADFTVDPVQMVALRRWQRFNSSRSPFDSKQWAD